MFAITWRPFGTHRINKRLSCQLRGARFGFPIARAAIEIVAVVCLMLRHNRRPLPEPAFHIFTDAVAARSTTVKLLRSRLSFTMQIPDTAMRYAKFLYTLDVLWMTAL